MSRAPHRQLGRCQSQCRRASACVMMIVLIATLQIVVAGIILAGGRSSDLVARRVESARAFYAAEAAVNLGLRELAVNTDLDADGVIGSISNDSNASNDPLLTSNRLVAGVTTMGNQTTVQAVGVDDLATRSVAAVLTSTTVGSGASATTYALSSWADTP